MTTTPLPRGPVRTNLVVLSERRPRPGEARQQSEAAIERALREHDGVWVTLPTDARGHVPLRPLNDDPTPQASEDWPRYVRANTAYGERILDLVTMDGAVWLVGDAWLLVAAVLRAGGHRGPIGLRLERPFPPRARFATLPWGDEIMAALCRLDLLACATRACADHVAACAPHGQEIPILEVFPPAAEPGAGPSFLEHLAHARRRRLVDRPA